MNINEFEILKSKTYNQCIKYFLEKYGEVRGTYFVNDTYNSKNNKITRTNEGLYIHHIKENIAIQLSNKKDILKNDYPFEWQKGKYLVYVNLLEHLFLHLKIHQKHPKPYIHGQLPGIGGAINYMIPELNDIYSGIKFNQKWKIIASSKIKKEKETYIKLLRFALELGIDKECLKSSSNAKNGWNILKNSELFKMIDKI